VPDVQSLFPPKATETQLKDDADFAVVFPLLGRDEAQWLAEVLHRLYPRYRWLNQMPAVGRGAKD
jgi:hypothetical protein